MRTGLRYLVGGIEREWGSTRPIDQSTNRPIDRSTNRPIDRSTPSSSLTLLHPRRNVLLTSVSMKRGRDSECACARPEFARPNDHDRSQEHHYGHRAFARRKAPARPRASVAVTERALCNMCILGGDGRIMTSDAELERVRVMLEIMGPTLAEGLGGADAGAARRYASAIESSEFACVMERNSLSFDYSQLHLEERFPSPIDGAFGPSTMPLRNLHAFGQYVESNEARLVVRFEASATHLRAAHMLLCLTDHRTHVLVYPEVAEADDHERCDGDGDDAARLTLAATGLDPAETVGATLWRMDDFTHSKVHQCMCALVRREGQCTLKDHMQAESDYVRWLEAEGLDARRHANSFEPPLFISAAVSRFANGLRLPIVFDAARLIEYGLMDAHSAHRAKFVQWSVAPINDTVFMFDRLNAATTSQDRSKGVRHMRIVSTFHPSFATCVARLYHKTWSTKCTPKLILAACGAPLGDKDERCVRGHPRLAADRCVCTDNVSVKLQCTHANAQTMSQGHQLVLTDEEFAFVRTLMRVTERTHVRVRETAERLISAKSTDVCGECVSGEEEVLTATPSDLSATVACELRDELAALERSLTRDEMTIDRSLLQTCTMSCDLNMSLHMANLRARHTSCPKASSAQDARSTKCNIPADSSTASDVAYRRLRYEPMSHYKCNMPLHIDGKTLTDHFAYVYGRLTPVRR